MPGTTPTRGDLSNDKDLAHEPVDHALGRSRGGLSTKIHALTDRFYCPLTIMLSPGQAGDNPYLVPLLQAHQLGDATAFRLLADKAYSHPSTRAHLRAKGIAHTIPERSDQIARRKAKGQTGGRPPAFDAPTYKVASRSFLSTKTVEFHLIRIYRKLGVRNRAELARTVTPSGLAQHPSRRTDAGNAKYYARAAGSG